MTRRDEDDESHGCEAADGPCCADCCGTCGCCCHCYRCRDCGANIEVKEGLCDKCKEKEGSFLADAEDIL